LCALSTKYKYFDEVLPIFLGYLETKETLSLGTLNYISILSIKLADQIVESAQISSQKLLDFFKEWSLNEIPYESLQLIYIAIRSICQSSGDSKTEFNLFSSSYNYIVDNYKNKDLSEKLSRVMNCISMMITEFPGVLVEMDDDNWDQIDVLVFGKLLLSMESLSFEYLKSCLRLISKVWF